MARYLAVLLLMCIVPAVCQAPNHILIWWMERYEPVVPELQGKLPPGVLLFVQDESADTTDYWVSIEYRDSYNKTKFLEGKIERTARNEWSTRHFPAANIFVIDRVTATAYESRVTGRHSTTSPVWWQKYAEPVP